VKLALIITGLATGGAEMMLLKVLERIDRRRFSPHVISLTTLGEIGAHIAALGIPVEAIGMKPGWPSPFAFFRLLRRLRAIRPEVIHTWMYHPDLLGGLAARLAGVSALGWGIRHSDLSQRANKRSTLAVVEACARLSHWLPKRIMANSEVARQAHVNRGYAAEKMVVVPNGFDLTRFQPDSVARVEVRRELAVAAETPLVGLIGRFHLQKNHLGFIDAATILHRRMPEVHFILAGNGVDSRNIALVQAAESAGVAEVCHFLGQRKDIPRLMAALDVLASSSIGEAFPNVLGEAMACAVPCAVTDVGDSAYIVGDTGKVVASGDMTGLAAALESLLNLPLDQRRSLGEEARVRVAERFEIGKVVRMYEAFYEELAESNHRNKVAATQ
jgi:glycosyltransferase involved in cell wall biosynthesis